MQYIADRVLVMYLGQVVESARSKRSTTAPRHPYTRALLDSRLTTNPADRIEKPPLAGDPPNPINPPSGCRFRTRCPFAEAVCETRMPRLGAWDGDRDRSPRRLPHGRIPARATARPALESRAVH